ncbi:DUF1801 domain-containing protein [Labrys sp. KB_33_2]|uniref:DUF1801 domain-containing protein n=1 Tax=Labrys sp. KB_33_2 TaxID=3237479 RepID=UPI003F8F2E77
MPMLPFADAAISSTFAALPQHLCQPVLGLREMILEVGSSLPELGGMVETLKWGEPAYHPVRKRVGTTIRINAHRRSENCYALYVPCQTRLVELYRSHYPDIFTYEGRRALLFYPATPPPDAPLQHCIAMALTCHLRGHGAR